MAEKISIVLPVYNEEEGIQETIKRLSAFIDSRQEVFEIVFVDDGSIDKSVDIIQSTIEQDNRFRLVCFSRNFGHQIAITAGIRYATGDAIVVMDADLQDPPEVVGDMIDKWHEGYDVVYGKRLQREGETIFKKFTAKMFYRVFRDLTSIDMPLDTGDFRLINRRVAQELMNLNEQDPFVRGEVSWVGFKQTSVEYYRQERFAGETKYPLSKMIKLAIDGITSFSQLPLKFATWSGEICLALTFIYVIYRLFMGGFGIIHAMFAVVLFGFGIIFIILGIFGAYLSRIFVESKDRPLFIVAEAIGYNESEKQKLKENNIIIK